MEREEKEDKDKKRIQDEDAKSNLRIKEINKILSKSASIGDGSDSDSDDDLEDLEGLRAELKALEDSIADNRAKLDHYEKNKKWNVDNMVRRHTSLAWLEEQPLFNSHSNKV